jgi:membrane-bound ClpP family serine protease
MWRPLRDFLQRLNNSNQEPQEELGGPFTPLSIQWFSKPIAAEVVTKIKPDRPGQVSFKDIVWNARSTEPLEQAIPKRQAVIIVGRQGNTLLVSPPQS